jgi:hypothetical protein
MQDRRIKRLGGIGTAMMLSALACFLGALSFYYWPSLPRVPRESSGNVIPIRNHDTMLYLTREQWWIQWSLFLLSIALFGTGIAIDKHLQLVKRRG